MEVEEVIEIGMIEEVTEEVTGIEIEDQDPQEEIMHLKGLLEIEKAKVEVKIEKINIKNTEEILKVDQIDQLYIIMQIFS